MMTNVQEVVAEMRWRVTAGASTPPQTVQAWIHRIIGFHAKDMTTKVKDMTTKVKVARGWAPKDHKGILWLYKKKSDLDFFKYVMGTRPVRVVIVPLAEYRRLKRQDH